MNDTTKRERRRSYFLFFLIGVLSFLIGFFVGEGFLELAGIFEILFILLVFFILFGTGLYISKQRSLGFAFKAFTISFIALFLIFAAVFTWSAHEHYYAKSIHVRKLHDKPSEYVNITEEELNEYPALKKAIKECAEFNKDSCWINVHPDEWMRTIDFINEKGSDIIKVGNEYYEIRFAMA